MEKLTNDEKIKAERAFDLLIKQECGQVDYSEIMHKLEIYKRE